LEMGGSCSCHGGEGRWQSEKEVGWSVRRVIIKGSSQMTFVLVVDQCIEPEFAIVAAAVRFISACFLVQNTFWDVEVWSVMTAQVVLGELFVAKMTMENMCQLWFKKSFIDWPKPFLREKIFCRYFVDKWLVLIGDE
jgi:hypothetical protein